MEGRAHHIMVMARQYTQTSSFVEVPQSQSLIITGGQDPGKFCRIGMELHRTDVIEMAQ